MKRYFLVIEDEEFAGTRDFWTQKELDEQSFNELMRILYKKEHPEYVSSVLGGS